MSVCIPPDVVTFNIHMTEKEREKVRVRSIRSHLAVFIQSAALEGIKWPLMATLARYNMRAILFCWLFIIVVNIYLPKY